MKLTAVAILKPQSSDKDPILFGLAADLSNFGFFQRGSVKEMLVFVARTVAKRYASFDETAHHLSCLAMFGHAKKAHGSHLKPRVPASMIMMCGNMNTVMRIAKQVCPKLDLMGSVMMQHSVWATANSKKRGVLLSCTQQRWPCGYSFCRQRISCPCRLCYCQQDSGWFPGHLCQQVAISKWRQYRCHARAWTCSSEVSGECPTKCHCPNWHNEFQVKAALWYLACISQSNWCILPEDLRERIKLNRSVINKEATTGLVL